MSSLSCVTVTEVNLKLTMLDTLTNYKNVYFIPYRLGITQFLGLIYKSLS